MAAVIALLEEGAWTSEVAGLPGPTFHLDLTIAHRDHTVTVRWHIEDGRPSPTECDRHPCPSADLCGAITVPATRVLDVLDVALDDPLLAILAPPADAAMSFDALLYIGGLIDTWVPALRRASRSVEIDAVRTELAEAGGS